MAAALANLALVVAPDLAEGRIAELDDRGRLQAPAWLRQRGRDVLVGLDHEAPMLFVAPIDVLDRFGDVLSGPIR